MLSDEKWQWTFLAFKSEEDGYPVQSWFDGLPQDHRLEIAVLLAFMQAVTSRKWGRPEFDPLDGAGGISEIRPTDIRCEQDGIVKKITYRLYGMWGTEELKHSYIFLHGTSKGVKNDRDGKAIARDRLERFRRGNAEVGVHTFCF
jgi:hypothetical protein